MQFSSVFREKKEARIELAAWEFLGSLNAKLPYPSCEFVTTTGRQTAHLRLLLYANVFVRQCSNMTKWRWLVALVSTEERHKLLHTHVCGPCTSPMLFLKLSIIYRGRASPQSHRYRLTIHKHNIHDTKFLPILYANIGLSIQH